MIKTWMAGAALALAMAPAAAVAQEGKRLDCVVTTATPTLKASIGGAMTGEGDDASRGAVFEQLGAVVDGCAAKHKIAETDKATYFDYSLARISREWLIGDIAKANLKTSVVDRALDFGPSGANPDLSGEMTDDQINAIVQAYIAEGVNIDAVDQKVWEKVGAYAAATSIYWNKRKLLPFK
jgi:hypothetical protein